MFVENNFVLLLYVCLPNGFVSIVEERGVAQWFKLYATGTISRHHISNADNTRK